MLHTPVGLCVCAYTYTHTHNLLVLEAERRVLTPVPHIGSAATVTSANVVMLTGHHCGYGTRMVIITHAVISFLANRCCFLCRQLLEIFLFYRAFLRSSPILCSVVWVMHTMLSSKPQLCSHAPVALFGLNLGSCLTVNCCSSLPSLQPTHRDFLVLLVPCVNRPLAGLALPMSSVVCKVCFS